MTRIFFVLLCTVLPSPAFAHLGLVGVLAGHAHALAWAVAIAAAALAALLAAKNDEASDETDDGDEAEAEPV